MGKLITHLAAATGLAEHDVSSIMARAPRSYKFYKIDKRTKGKRLISQPAREVKALQRALVNYLPDLPIHRCATAYRTGLSIRHNAEMHAANGPIMKFDFKEFFHSIRARDWVHYCRQNEVFPDWEDVVLSSRLLFHLTPGSNILRLAMGAPSSPWLSNVLMYEFDSIVSKAVAKDKVTYTRYADDLTFSADRTGYLNVVEKVLRKTINQLEYPSLVLNEEKTTVATTKYRRVVTGLVLSNDGRVTIGRDRKRILRSALDRALNGKNSDQDNIRLAGYLSFVSDVEPLFMEKIYSRFGKDIIDRLSASADGAIAKQLP